MVHDVREGQSIQELYWSRQPDCISPKQCCVFTRRAGDKLPRWWFDWPLLG